MISKIFCSLLFSLISVCSVAQTTDTRKIAPFKIQVSASGFYWFAQLKKDMPVILIYFAPDCDHCKEFAKQLMDSYSILNKKQVVMISYFPLQDVLNFSKQYKLSGKPNIVVGTEGYSFIVQKYYNIQHFPFIVLYDKKGNFSSRFAEETAFSKIKEAILRLQ